MVALPQLMDPPVLPELTISLRKGVCNENALTCLEREIAQSEEVVGAVERFASWITQLRLNKDQGPQLTEAQVAQYVAGIESLSRLDDMFTGVLDIWVTGVDEQENWRGPEKHVGSLAARVKELDVRLQELAGRARALAGMDREDLIGKLYEQVACQRELGVAERIRFLRTAIIDVPIDNPISMRRADWYGDDA